MEPDYSVSAEKCDDMSMQVPWFGEEGGNTTLADVHQNFHRFRSSGLRLHYWP